MASVFGTQNLFFLYFWPLLPIFFVFFCILGRFSPDFCIGNQFFFFFVILDPVHPQGLPLSSFFCISDTHTSPKFIFFVLWTHFLRFLEKCIFDHFYLIFSYFFRILGRFSPAFCTGLPLDMLPAQNLFFLYC